MAIKHSISATVIATLFTVSAWAQSTVDCVNGITAPPVADRIVSLYGGNEDAELRLDGDELNRSVQMSLRNVGQGDQSPTHLLYVGQGKNDKWGFTSTAPLLQWRSYDLNVSPAFKNGTDFYVGYSTLRYRYAVGGPVQAPKPEDFLDGSWEPFISANTKWLSGLLVYGGKTDATVYQRGIPNGPPTNADGTLVFCRAQEFSEFSCSINVPKTDRNGAGFRVHLVNTPAQGQGKSASCSATNYYLLPGSIAVFGKSVTDGLLLHRQF